MLRPITTSLLIGFHVFGICHFVAAEAKHDVKQAAKADITFTTPPLQINNLSPDLWARGVSLDTKQIEIDFDKPSKASPILPTDPHALLPPLLSKPAATPQKLVIGSGMSNPDADDLTKHNSVCLPMKLEEGRVYVVPLNLDVNGNADSKNVTYLVFQTDGKILPENAPPLVKSIEIQAAADNETPTVPTQTCPTLVRIAFNKPMDPATQGFVVTQNDQPVNIPASQMAFNKKTQTWEMKFAPQPGLVTIQLNNETNIGFRSAAPKSIPLWPVQLSFQVPFQGSLHQSSQQSEDSDNGD